MTAAYQFPPRPTMTAQEVAEACGVTPHHIYQQAKKGLLPTVSGLGRRIKFPTAVIKQMLHVETEKPASASTETSFPETKTDNLRNGLSGQQEA